MHFLNGSIQNNDTKKSFGTNNRTLFLFLSKNSSSKKDKQKKREKNDFKLEISKTNKIVR